MSFHLFQFFHFNSIISNHSCRVNSFISIHSFQFMHVSSFLSIPSFQFIHVKSFISIPSFQFIHFNWFMSIHAFHAFHFIFTSSQLTMNSYKPHPFFETSAPARAGHYLVGFGARLDRPKYMFQRRFRDAWVRGPFWQLLVIMSWYCCSIKLPSNILLHSTPIRPRESPAKNTQKQLQVWQMSENQTRTIADHWRFSASGRPHSQETRWQATCLANL